MTEFKVGDRVLVTSGVCEIKDAPATITKITSDNLYLTRLDNPLAYVNGMNGPGTFTSLNIGCFKPYMVSLKQRIQILRDYK